MAGCNSYQWLTTRRKGTHRHKHARKHVGAESQHKLAAANVALFRLLLVFFLLCFGVKAVHFGRRRRRGKVGKPMGRVKGSHNAVRSHKGFRRRGSAPQSRWWQGKTTMQWKCASIVVWLFWGGGRRTMWEVKRRRTHEGD